MKISRLVVVLSLLFPFASLAESVEQKVVPPLISTAGSGKAAKSYINSSRNSCKPFSKYIYTEYGTAIDPRTGLEWTRCMLGQTWNGSACTGNAITKDIGMNLKELKSHLSDVQFAGSSEWRLPTGGEMSISFHEDEPIECQKNSSAFVPPFLYSMSDTEAKDPRFFTAPYRSNGMDYDSLDSYGYGNEMDPQKIKGHLICDGNYCSRRQGYDLSGAGWIFVRLASKSIPKPEFGANEFIDPATSLTWLRCPVGAKVAIENGVELCKAFDTSQFSIDEALHKIQKDYRDWRLPTPTEIMYLVGRSAGMNRIPYWLTTLNRDSCSYAASTNARIFPNGPHRNDSFVYAANSKRDGWDRSFRSVNLVLHENYCALSASAYGTEKLPLFLVKGHDSSGNWEKLVSEKLTAHKVQVQASQQIQRDNLAFESSFSGKLLKSLFGKAPDSASANSPSQASGGGAFVCTGKCTGSWMKNGSTFTVSVSAPSLDKAREAAAEAANKDVCKADAKRYDQGMSANWVDVRCHAR